MSDKKVNVVATSSCRVIRLTAENIDVNSIDSLSTLSNAVNVDQTLITQSGDTLTVNLNNVSAKVFGNLEVTGSMDIQTNTTTDVVLLPDNTGNDHLLFFENGLLTSYTQGGFFKIQVNTANSGTSLPTQFELPLVSTGTYNMTVLWGDDTEDVITSWDSPLKIHTYPTSGVYQIVISGTCIGWVFNNLGDKLKLLTVEKWGTDFRLGTTEGNYFYGCTNLQITDTDPCILTGTTNLNRAFQGCITLNANIGNWDTSSVTTMASVFNGCNNFNNGEVTTVPSVTPLTASFATLTSQLTCPGANFGGAGSGFTDQTLWVYKLSGDNYDVFVSSSTYFNATTLTLLTNISGANILAGSIYNVQQAMTLGGVNPSLAFYNNSGAVLTCPDASFTAALTGVTVQIVATTGKYTSVVTYVSATTLTLTNPVLSNLAAGTILNIINTYGVTPSTATYTNATKTLVCPGATFPASIVSKKIWIIASSGTSYSSVVATRVDGTTLILDTALGVDLLVPNSITNISQMSIGQKPLLWKTDNTTSLFSMFSQTKIFNQPMVADGTYWNTGNVTNFSSTFDQAFSFNQNIGSWNVSKATTMLRMFQFCPLFNNGEMDEIKNWTAPLCTDFLKMFFVNKAFNQPLQNLATNTKLVNTGALPTGTTCDLTFMLNQASLFNQNIGSWDVSKVSSFYGTLYQLYNFNNGNSDSIKNWNAPLCTSFRQMLGNSFSFNQPLTSLLANSAAASIDCYFMFQIGFIPAGAAFTVSQFNNGDTPGRTIGTKPLTSWNLSRATRCDGMFSEARNFNQNIGTWNLSNVTSLATMFFTGSATGTLFNNGGSSVFKWSTSKCTNFSNMFTRNLNFNQSLTNLVDNSELTANCTLASMMSVCTNFNNGESGASLISSIKLVDSFYNDSNQTLNCPSGGLSVLTTNDVLVIQTASAIYISQVSILNSNTQVTLATAFGSSISAPNITSITKQIPTPLDPVTVSYATAGSILTCSSGGLLTVSTSDVLFIRTASINYLSQVQTVTSDTQVVLTTNYMSDIGLGTITSITKQVSIANAFNILNPATAYFTAATSVLICNSGGLSGLKVNDVLVIQTATFTYSSAVQAVDSDAQVTLVTSYGSNIPLGTITSITTTQGPIMTNSVDPATASYNNSNQVLTCTSGGLSALKGTSAVIIQTASNIYVSDISDTQLILSTNLGTTLPLGTITAITKQVPVLPFPILFNSVIATYTSASKELSYTAGGFLATFVTGDTVVFQTSTSIYTGVVSATFTDTTITLVNDTVGTNLTSGSILSITKQVATSIIAANASYNGITSVLTCSSDGLSVFSPNDSLLLTTATTMYFSTVSNTQLVLETSIGSNLALSSITAITEQVPLSTFNFSSTSYTNSSRTLTCSTGNFQNLTVDIVLLIQTAGFRYSSKIESILSPTQLVLTNAYGSDIPLGTITSITQHTVITKVDASTASVSVVPGGGLLTCPSGGLISLAVNDVLLIRTASILYAARVSVASTNDTSLTLSPAYTSAINSGITSITKQVAGTRDLLWKTVNTSSTFGVTSFASTFQSCRYFNQKISTPTPTNPNNYWNMTKATTVVSMFLGGSTAFVNLFNNGQIVGGNTQLLNWSVSASVTKTNWNANSKLVAGAGGNGVTTPQL